MKNLPASPMLLMVFLAFGCSDTKTSATDGGAQKKSADSATPATVADAGSTTATTNTFTIKSYGTFTSPADQGGPVTQVTDKLQFAFIGSKGNGKADNGGGNIYFPMGAATGTYTIKVITNGTGLGAHEASLDMTGGVEDHGIKNVAQSGSVSLKVSGTKYTITFKDLPSLDQNKRADQLSGNFSW